MPVRSALVFPLVAASLLLAPGCSSDPVAEVELPSRPGLAVAASDVDVVATVRRLDAALAGAEDVGVVAEVDHDRNAQLVSLALRPTRVRLFGNPAVGTPLMQANILAGLDLPQKMLVFEDEDGQAVVAYNTAEYLAARYGIAGTPSLAPLAAALEAFAQDAAGPESEVRATPAAGVGVEEGIVTVASDADAGVTYDRLRSALASNSAVTIVAEVDHQANASRAGFTLRPSRVIVFGNPRLGTPLMQASQTAGIDLPQTMLVYQSAPGRATVAYEDPGYLAERHGIPMSLEQIEQIRTALGQLAVSATTEL